MVQRSSTHIVKSDSLMDIGLGDLYSEQAVAAGMTTEKADLIFASLPYRIMHEFQIPLYDADARARQGLLRPARGGRLRARLGRRRLRAVHEVPAPRLGLLHRRRRLPSWSPTATIKLAHGQVDHLTEDSVVLADGTELPADVVVYATGYGSMNGWVADLIGQDVADKVGKVLGPRLGHHQGPRPVGGRAAQHVEADPAGRTCGSTAATCTSRGTTRCTSRCSSRPATRASPTPVYGLQEVHHLS